jgi:hypothetical protein
MKQNQKRLLIGILTLALAVLFAGNAICAKAVTIVGTVTDTYQIEDENGMLYDIGDTEQGQEVSELVGQQVEVQGTLEEQEEGVKVIFITAYKIVIT